MTAGLLLAAGESTRMGQSKPLLDWGGEVLVVYQVRQLLDAGLGRVVGVLGDRAEAVTAALAPLASPRLQTVTNEAYAQGKVGSVLRGLEALTVGDGPFLVLSVDQPRPASLLRSVLDAHNAGGALITVPRYQGRGGHPTIFSGALYDEMLAIEEATLGLRAVVQRHRTEVQYVELSDPLVTLDINDETAYAAALARTLRPDAS